MGLADLEQGAVGGHRLERIVFEYEQAVEQRPAAAPGELLDLVQRAVLVGPHLGLPVLEPAQALHHFRSAEIDAHRQGVDERADHLPGPGQVRRPTGDGDPEGHLPTTAETPEENRPGPQDDGVEGQPQFASHLLEARALRRRQPQLKTLAGGRAVVAGSGPGQIHRLRQALQLPPPIAVGRCTVLARQPVDITAERPRRRTRRRRRAGACGSVVFEHLAHQQRQRPTVEQRVVVGPDEEIARGGQPRQDHAHQRRPGQLEAAQLRAPQLFRPAALFVSRMIPPVELAPGNLEAPADESVHVTLAGDERCAQRRLAVEDLLVGPAQGSGIQRTGPPRCQLIAQLGQVDLGLRRQPGVEEHALLQRREPVDVLDPGLDVAALQALESRRLESGQGEVRRREAPRPGRRAVGDQLAQGGQEARRQPLDGGPFVHRPAVGPVDLELAGEHRAGDVDQVAPAVARTRPPAAGLGGAGEKGRALDLAVEPAEVVERDLGCRQPAQRLFAAQVAQQTPADATAGDAAQLLLDRLQGLPRPTGTGQVEHHRIDRGEPADGARQVDVLEQVLAAVPFEIQ